ncbi:MAG: glycoside hydrolase family 9 protein [Cyclobacteriaceae bacterium]|nr:glycoside hydrolase family 9 protein [Cyclobacteriaceae bacterium]
MKKSIFLFSTTLLLLLISVRCDQKSRNQAWSVNEYEYLEAPGFNVLVFHNDYPVGKQGGIEFIHHDDRIATNGFIQVDLPSGGNLPMPESAERKVDTENRIITASIKTPGSFLDYDIRVWPAEGAVHMAVDLKKPIPSEYKNKVRFDLLLYPVAYRGKTYQLGDKAGIFPFEGLGPMDTGSGGDRINVPLATGPKLIIAAEDPQYKLEIENLNGSLALIDGRNTSLGGWFIISATIPEGAEKGALEWKITPNLVPDWYRQPVIGLSQVGYHPMQEKKAIIELDSRTARLEEVVLYRFDKNGMITRIRSGLPKKWGNFLRYAYAIYDFSDVSEQGLYQVEYGDIRSEPFVINKEVYRENVWQPTLEIYFPVQMCHMRIRDRVRVWHGACHLDDALQAPVAIEHTDGYRSYAGTETRYEPLTPIPGLNRGGWHDAGDNDLAAGSQAQTTLFLALADETFGIEVDQTTVDQNGLFVELRHPDGIPDLEQQIEHGAINLLSGYRASGHSFVGIIATREGRAFLGDVASLTDQHFYDASLKTDEIQGNRSGKPDDRWVFTNRDTSLEYEVITALAAASRILRGYNEALAEECLETAVRAWKYEQDHDPVIQPNAYVPGNFEIQEVLATAELYVTTRDEQYKTRLMSLLPVIRENISRTGWAAARAIPFMNDENYRTEIRDVLKTYQSELENSLNQNPYGIPWNPRVWGIGWNIQEYAIIQYFLNKEFPDMFDRENVLRVVNYVLGCHPASNTSLVSGVGAHSLTAAYGFNMHWWSYIPGGMASGTALIRPDFPELKEPFPFLWQQTEYVMPGAASYMFCVMAADHLLNGQ